MHRPSSLQPHDLMQLTDEAAAALEFVPRWDGRGTFDHWKQEILQAVSRMPAALPDSKKGLTRS